MFPTFGSHLDAFDDDTPVVLAPTPAQRVAATLLNDPAFRVLTVDGLAWLDPYTGMRVPAPFGYLEPAKAYLLANQPWTRTKPRPVAELQRLRWRLYLAEELENEARLRLFGPDGRWLNPFTASWVALPTRAEVITPLIVEEMATALAHNPGMRQVQLLDAQRLEELLRAARQSRATPPVARAAVMPAPVDPPTSVTTRLDPIRVDPVTGGPIAEPLERPAATRPADERRASASIDLAQARQVIQRMLPARPTIPGYAVATFHEPVSAVGGDFYECARLGDGRWFIALGDVSGHGAQGAMVAVGTLKSLRFILREHDDPVTILALLNDDLRRDLRAGQFVTMLALVLDAEARSATVLRAGHHHLLRLSATRAAVLEKLGEPGPALGLRDQAGFRRTLRPVAITLATGDRLVFTSDGLAEAEDGAGEQYGEPRLMGALVAQLEQPLVPALDQVTTAVKRHAGGALQDDATVLVIDCLDAPPALAGP